MLRFPHILAAIVVVLCLESIIQQPDGETRRILNAGDHTASLDSSLKVAVFGGGFASGVGLLEPYREAFPHILSDSVDNYAHPGIDNLNYFSTCLQTSIPDQKEYDVFILEYWLHYYEGLYNLVRKIHARFPNAKIILVKHWSPTMFRRKESISSHYSESFKEWKATRGYGDQTTDVDTVRQALVDDTGYWYFPERERADRVLADIAENYGGFVAELAQLEDARLNLVGYLPLFDSQQHRLNKDGHQAIAETIATRFNYRVPDPLVLTENRVKTSSWGGGDRCEFWYTTGLTNLVFDTSAFDMVPLDGRDNRFGLEVTKPGWINVTNPFKEPRALYLTFLASKTRSYYEKVVVKGFGVNHLILDPDIDEAAEESWTRTVAIGSFPHGTYTLSITPQHTPQSIMKFGLVGVIFTDGSAAPMEYGFGQSFVDKAEAILQEEIHQAEGDVEPPGPLPLTSVPSNAPTVAGSEGLDDDDRTFVDPVAERVSLFKND